MTAKEINEPFFVVRRLTPEEVTVMLAARLRQDKMSKPKAYNITSDEQRFELVRRVLAKELTIKEVSDMSNFLGCKILLYEVHHSQDNPEDLQKGRQVWKEEAETQKRLRETKF
jgi:hypothetical protein